MKLRDCTMGTLIQDMRTKEIGMVIGITNNISSVLSEEQREPSRAIPLVQWQTGRKSGIHAANIEKLK